jgi:hypothetical protein
MVDRQKVETILMRRFPGAAYREVAAATNAIMGLEDEWEEIFWREHSPACRRAPSSDPCELGHRLQRYCEIRLLGRRAASPFELGEPLMTTERAGAL